MSEVKVNKLSPRSGTTVTIGDSGDTINIVGTLQNNGSALTGDISSVVAGTGLSGGGTSGDVTLNIESAQPTITSLGTLTGLTTTGNINLGDNDKVIFGAGSDLEIYHSGTQSIISDVGSGNLNLEGDAKIVLRNTGGTENYAQFFKDGAVELYHNNTKKIETTASGAAVAGDVQVDNGGSLGFGGSNYKIEGSSSANHRIAFHTDGSERARFDSSGNLGIGTSSPVSDAKLTISSDNTESNIFFERSGSTRFDTAIANSTGNILFKGGANSSTVSGLSEFMRIVADTGRVGIGTSTIPARFTVSDADSAFIYVEENTGNTGDTSGILFKTSASNPGFFKSGMILEDDGTTYARGKLHIVQNSATNDTNATVSDSVVTILNNGKVGIGESSPNAKLHVDDSGGANVLISRTNTGEGIYFESDGTNGAVRSTSSTGSLLFQTNGNNERMRIASNGHVGIGTSTTTFALNISNGAGNMRIKTTDSANLANAATSIVEFHGTDNRGGYVGFVGGDMRIVTDTHSAGEIEFHTNGAERMRVDSSGNLLVGTTSAQGGTAKTLQIADGSSARLLLQNTGGGRTYGFFAGTNGKLGLFDYSGSAERLNIDTNGFVNINNPTVSGQFNVKGAGFIILGETTAGANSSAVYQSKRSANGIQFRFVQSSTVCGDITTNGSAVSYGSNSDYRLKENVEYNFDATTRLKQLKPARFNFIADADTTVDGFIAHEVQTVVPEAITGTKDAVDEDGNPEYQGIDQSKLVPLLVKTIQELEARITTLENA